MQHGRIPVLRVHARSSEFEHFLANPLERSEIKKLLAVISEIPLGAESALHAVRSHQFPGVGIADHQMIANEIISVAIKPNPRGAREPLSQLAIKNQITQALAIDQILQCLRHASSKLVRGRKRIVATVLQDSGRCHA